LHESLLRSFSLLHFGFVVFWRKNIGAKAALKMLMKLTPRVYQSKIAFFNPLVKKSADLDIMGSKFTPSKQLHFEITK